MKNFGVPSEDSHDRFCEAVDIFLQVWNSERLTQVFVSWTARNGPTQGSSQEITRQNGGLSIPTQNGRPSWPAVFVRPRL